MKKITELLNIKCNTAIVLKALVCIVLIVVGCGATYVESTLNNINYEALATDVAQMPEKFDDDGNKVNGLDEGDKELKWEDLGLTATSVEGVTNILLCGEEAIEDDGRGRTDCIMLATINNEQNSLKLISFMRDLYVKIPGYSNNKLNASYQIGGMPLLQQTIETNFGIKIDGYVLVNFKDFEKVIDKLGGVEIRLTKQEAKYLRRTNYISKKSNRNVKEGKQLLNGNQALGYCRVRYVKTDSGLTDDYGRNYRQRMVLEAIFNKYKSATAAEVVELCPEVLKCITTDITKDNILKYIYNALMLNASTIECYRVPMEGCYKDAKIDKMAVLYITDINGIRNSLSDYIYGTVDAGGNLVKSYEYYGEAPTPRPTVYEKPVVYNFSPRPKNTPKPVVTKKPTEKPVKTKKPTKTPKPVKTKEPDIVETPPEDIETPQPEVPVETAVPSNPNPTDSNTNNKGDIGNSEDKNSMQDSSLDLN